MPEILRMAAGRGLFLMLFLFLGACAKSAGTPAVPADSSLAVRTWERFMAGADRAENISGPFRLNATLYYSGKEDSDRQRVTVYFWGNGRSDTPLPLRLDVLMGPGSVMAAARQDSRGFFVHVPREAAVYFAEDGNLAAALDLPLPFSLADLSYLITGRYAKLFAPREGTVPAALPATGTGGGGAVFRYAVDTAPLPGVVTLGADGLPLAWSDGKENGWTVDIEYWPDSTRTTPRKVYVKNAEGREATLIVRELSFPQEAFSPAQLELKAPPGTRLAPLAVSQ